MCLPLPILVGVRLEDERRKHFVRVQKEQASFDIMSRGFSLPLPALDCTQGFEFFVASTWSGCRRGSEWWLVGCACIEVFWDFSSAASTLSGYRRIRQAAVCVCTSGWVSARACHDLCLCVTRCFVTPSMCDLVPPAPLPLPQKKLAAMQDNSLQSLATLTDLHRPVWRRALAH